MPLCAAAMKSVSSLRCSAFAAVPSAKFAKKANGWWRGRIGRWPRRPQTSPQAQPVCSQAALVADATAQAQALAGAAGVSVGQITALDGVASLAARVGAFTYGVVGSGLASFVLPLAPPLPTTCSLLVQFQLY